MSYDIYLSIDTGGEDAAIVAEVGNYTSNCSPMWNKALGSSLRNLNGRNAGKSLPLLIKAVAHMRANPDEYMPLNPANGWGDYESATDYLDKLRRLCEEHPKTTIVILA